MKRYDTIRQMEEGGAPPSVIKFVKNTVSAYEEYGAEDVDDLDFMLGGGIYVIETFEDLKKVPTLEESKFPKEQQDPDTNGWASIVETAAPYDLADYLEERDYIILFLATNNAGGPAYYIPVDIADQCPNIAESIRLTNT